MGYGVCLDALNAWGHPTPGALRMAGADGGRLVAFDDQQFPTYHNTLHNAGLTTAVVLARESCANNDYGGWASFYAQQVTPTYWVLGNEPDAYILPEPSPSSWAMRPAEYAAFWATTASAILAHQPAARLIVGGLVSGQVWWAANLRPLLAPQPYGWDIHPYSKTAEEARSLLLAYQDVLG